MDLQLLKEILQLNNKKYQTQFTKKICNNNQKNQYFINNGDEFSPYQFGESSSISYGVTLGDFSGNGKLDIIVSNSGSRNIVYYNQSK